MANCLQSLKPVFLIINLAMAPIRLNNMKKKATKMNAKGEIITWDGSSKDGVLLKSLVSTGQTDGLTATQVMKAFPQQFQKYNSRTFASALNNARKSFEAEVNAARAGGSSCKYKSTPMIINHQQTTSIPFIF
jgi:hypothetical protein